jgi:hypothetical protein
MPRKPAVVIYDDGTVEIVAKSKTRRLAVESINRVPGVKGEPKFEHIDVGFMRVERSAGKLSIQAMPE